jgi:proprotein convertase subtilisin/kexin type 5
VWLSAVSNCNISFHCSFSNGTMCTSCASGCLICTGPSLSSADCISCSTIGHYYNASNIGNVCPSCDPTCYRCLGSLSNQCTGCNAGLLFYMNTCIQTCPTGYYGQEDLGLCTSCAANCKSCFGGLTTQCLSCVTNYYLSFYQCVNTCPSNYFTSSAMCYL